MNPNFYDTVEQAQIAADQTDEKWRAVFITPDGTYTFLALLARPHITRNELELGWIRLFERYAGAHNSWRSARM